MIDVAIAAYLISVLPMCRADLELPLETKAGQLAVAAEAIATVAETAEEAVWLTAIAYHESRFCYRTHAGGSSVRGRGRGLWQIEKGSRRLPPFEGLSLAETTHAASQALWLVRHSYQCGPSVKDRFTAYAGQPCDTNWPTLHARYRTYGWLTLLVSREAWRSSTPHRTQQPSIWQSLPAPHWSQPRQRFARLGAL